MILTMPPKSNIRSEDDGEATRSNDQIDDNVGEPSGLTDLL